MESIFGGGGRRMPSPLQSRGPLGRRMNQLHPHVLSKLPPDHPIFKVLPQLSRMVRGHEGPPQQFGQQTQPLPELQPGETPPWMNIPTDLSGLGEEQFGQPTQPLQEGYSAANSFSDAARALVHGRRPGAGGLNAGNAMSGNVRDRLLQQFQSALPQQPALTSRFALNRHLQRGRQGRGNLAAQPLLPLRKPRAY